MTDVERIRALILKEIKHCERMSKGEENKLTPDAGKVAALAEAMSKLVFAYYADPMELRPLKP